MRIILLCGLPGSGKSYWGSHSGIPFMDDLTQNGGLLEIKEKIDSGVLFGEELVISDYGFIFSDTRKAAEIILQHDFPDCTIEYIVFDNNPEHCWENVQWRDDNRCISKESLYRASKCYTYPERYDILPIYKPQ